MAKAPLECPECHVSWVGDLIPEVERPDWENACHWVRVYRVNIPLLEDCGHAKVDEFSGEVLTEPAIQCPGCGVSWPEDKWSMEKFGCGLDESLPDSKATEDDDIPKGQRYKPGSGEHPDPLAWARGEVGSKTKHNEPDDAE